MHQRVNIERVIEIVAHERAKFREREGISCISFRKFAAGVINRF